ncbi:MAG: tRNA pseudouridine(55) synthase TruB [Deltaproteobacteria bacterium]|nr:tRNA pseudouridine(55) synthase TruB [Deltaproteobacteria bacterium]
MDGIIVIDKPVGWTSHDAVAYVKKKLGLKKAGHLGTLDPQATGVLPLVVNGATRYARFFDAGDKRYQAVMKLGETTDTCDGAGRVLETRDASSVTEARVREVLAGFKGVIKQVPPMYSAIKKGGVPLYKLARKGVVVEREPREVTVYGLDVLRVELPYVEFILACSKGAYVRTICHDAGEALACGSHLTALRRLGCSVFGIAEAIDLTGPMGSAEGLTSGIISIQEALSRLPRDGEKKDFSCVLGDANIDNLC